MPDTLDEMICALLRQHDPIIKLHPYQLRLFTAPDRFTWNCWARQTGKSFILSLRRLIRGLTRRRRQIILSAGERQSAEVMQKLRRHCEALRLTTEFHGSRAFRNTSMRQLELVLPQGVRTHKDYLLSQLLIDGETAGNNSYDGVSFFNEAHVSGESGEQSNLLTAEAAEADEPTAGEFKSAMKFALGAMLGFRDDAGEPALISAGGMVCVVPPTMLFTASEAINSTVVDNTSNALRGIARVIALPWLTDLSKWYLLKTDGVIRPLIFQDREPVEFNALAEDSDEGFRREKFLFGVRARYRMTYGYWQHAVRIDFM